MRGLLYDAALPPARLQPLPGLAVVVVGAVLVPFTYGISLPVVFLIVT